MIRASALRRITPLRRGRRRPGDAARERRLAGGKIAVGRASATSAEYAAVKARVWTRAQGRCEVVLEGHVPTGEEELRAGWRCPVPARDPHHVVPRSAGGRETENNLIAICGWHHGRVAWPYRDGRLVIRPLSQGRFDCRLVFAQDKFEARRLSPTAGRGDG